MPGTVLHPEVEGIGVELVGLTAKVVGFGVELVGLIGEVVGIGMVLLASDAGLEGDH